MRNTELLDSPLNITFEVCLTMTDDEFREWFLEFRKFVVHLWDDKGLPPRVGMDDEAIRDQFKKLYGFDVNKFECVDENTGVADVVRNTSYLGNSVNEWFPTMMKTRINYTMDGEAGLSIYDHFAEDRLIEKTVRYSFRHFKRDSFYHYSDPIRIGDTVTIGSKSHVITEDAQTFIDWFENEARVYGTHDYWIDQRKEAVTEYTGYNEELKKVTWVRMSKDELALSNNIPERCLTNVTDKRPCVSYQIRLYKYGQKLFPLGLKAFRISWSQYAVNFPPLTAKYLYEKFTRHISDQKRVVVYDPSSGWGGRILGAMSARTTIPLHYVGTDPNTDHSVSENGVHRTKYEVIADFYNRTKNEAVLFKQANTYDVYQLGSEVIGNNENFQQYKGELDMVFTSPPYFSKEAYSDDPEQSYKKFSQYDTWRDGFLRPTLQTAVEYLREDRYLLWNIADAKFGNELLPLEQDSRDILESLGMVYQGVVKMALAQMPGGNRIDTETGKPKAKNCCRINGKWVKYEPIFVYYKPKSTST